MTASDEATVTELASIIVDGKELRGDWVLAVEAAERIIAAGYKRVIRKPKTSHVCKGTVWFKDDSLCVGRGKYGLKREWNSRPCTRRVGTGDYCPKHRRQGQA